ncbi:MAG TPA: uroporphyrinogen decarboxylase [Acidimicrobiia bacterium]|nr:uroporphyrinogen decarboxylase [Acidimicrobiia bacterium]
MSRLLAALDRQPLDRPPVWFMRQAGRYLPEYRELRSRHSFDEAMRTPALAAEITLQPLRRFPLDAAIVFADIMTPFDAMGIPIEFTPGPILSPLSLEDVAELGDLEPARLGFLSETIEKVGAELPLDVALVGFAGGPATLLAYLLEGGGSQHFPRFRRVFHGDDPTAALGVLARGMRTYLELQIDAGAQVVQLFDTWAGLLSREQFEEWAMPAARQALAGLEVPTIYFAPAASHLLDLLPRIGATGYGVDWRLPLGDCWSRLGEDQVVQGNLDPALLLSDPNTVRAGTNRVLEEAAGRPGHVFNLGHGVLPDTPLENVQAMVETVVGSAEPTEGMSRVSGAVR